MLIDRTHKPWIFGSTLVLAVSASAYWATAKHSVHGPTGGSVLGLILGIVGSLLMVFAALLAVRKRLPTWRVGSAQFWLRGHLWLGTLGFVLILFHAGFGWGGVLENLLWISFGLVVVTGFAGVALQQVIPRLLTTRVPLETMVAQIPFLSQTMQFRADQLVAKQAGVLDVDYEPLKHFAEEVLKQQRVLKRESDFPKELAKVYANVPLPEADAKKPTAHAPAAIIATKSAPANTVPLSSGEGGRRPGEGTEANASPSAPPAAAVETPPAAKPKSPLELMREKAAAKAAGGETAAPASANTSASPAAEPTKKLSPIEQMRAKAAAKPATEATATSEPTPESTAPAAEKKLSPIEQMRAKMAAKQAAPPVAESVAPPTDEASPAVPSPTVEATVPAAEKKLSPIEQMRAKMAAKSAEPPTPIAPPPTEASPEAPTPVAEVTPPAAEKKLSPIEQMRAKMAAKQAAPPVAESVAPPTDEASPAVPSPTVEATASAAEKKLSPIEQMRAKMAAKSAPTLNSTAPVTEQPATAPEKKLSPLEQMQAKLAAKATSADKSAETHKPLTVEKPVSSETPTADKPTPPPVKKPAPVTKPTAEKPVAATPKAPVKAAVPVPPALLAELRDFHIRVVRPFLSNGRSPQHRLDDGIAARRVFAQLRSDLPAELHNSLQELEDLCDERRQFNTQLRLHRWLHWWLILHIPPSIALLVLFVAHVIVSLRVVPFGK